jgi:hypothetical protein
MSKLSVVEKYNSSKSFPVSNLEDRNLQTIISGGIVNPMGPTLSALVIDGEIVIGAHLPILHISLNPFSNFVKEVGVVKCGEEWFNIDSILPILSNDFGSCPTLLLPSRIFPSEIDVKTLYAKYIELFDDAASTLKKIKKYPGDPMNRVQYEMDNIQDSITMPDRKIGSVEALEFVNIQTNSQNIIEELRAFIYAWSGSIEFQKKHGVDISIMSEEEFIRAFTIIAASCDLPIGE